MVSSSGPGYRLLWLWFLHQGQATDCFGRGFFIRARLPIALAVVSSSGPGYWLLWLWFLHQGQATDCFGCGFFIRTRLRIALAVVSSSGPGYWLLWLWCLHQCHATDCFGSGSVNVGLPHQFHTKKCWRFLLGNAVFSKLQTHILFLVEREESCRSKFYLRRVPISVSMRKRWGRSPEADTAHGRFLPAISVLPETGCYRVSARIVLPSISAVWLDKTAGLISNFCRRVTLCVNSEQTCMWDALCV